MPLVPVEHVRRSNADIFGAFTDWYHYQDSTGTITYSQNIS